MVSGYLINLITVSIACLLSLGKSKSSKFKIWGIAFLVPISLPLAYSLGISYSLMVENPWGTLLMLYVFPVIFMLGFVFLVRGILIGVTVKKYAYLPLLTYILFCIFLIFIPPVLEGYDALGLKLVVGQIYAIPVLIIADSISTLLYKKNIVDK